jgi:hypothetical protein
MSLSYAATKIMLIRHAEKPVPAVKKPPAPAYNGIDIFGEADKNSLIPQGWQRAGALNSLFSASFGPLPVPQFLFAPNKFGNGTSKRPYETITPLSQKLGLTINAAQDPKAPATYSKEKYPKMLKAATACDGVVLICWEHGEIPSLANRLLGSKSAPKWPADRFDIVWVFDLAPAGTGYTLNQVPQLLLATDKPAPILL